MMGWWDYFVPGMVVYICGIGTWENDAGGLQAWTMYGVPEQPEVL